MTGDNMTTITKPLLTTLRTEIDAALAELAAKHGVQIECGNASFTSTNATFKLAINTIGDGGEVVTKEAKDFGRYAGLVNNLKAEWLGESFTVRGETFKIIGYKPRSKKYPVLAENAKGVYKFSTETVVRAMGQ